MYSQLEAEVVGMFRSLLALVIDQRRVAAKDFKGAARGYGLLIQFATWRRYSAERATRTEFDRNHFLFPANIGSRLRMISDF